MSLNLETLETELAESLSEGEQDALTQWHNAITKSALPAADIALLDIPKRLPILGRWFLEGDLGFIYGPRGLGKTWLALLVARTLADGGKVGSWNVTAPVKTLYVDGEMAIDATLERSKALRVNADAGDNLIFLHHEPLFHQTGMVLNLTSLEAQEALTRYCVGAGIKVLFLDNISCLFTLKENEADAWGQFILPWLLELRRRRIAVVFVHHAGRNGLMRGTSKREDAAFWSIKLSEVKGESEANGAQFVATFDKNRNSTTEECPPLLWHFEPKSDGSVTPKWTPLTPLQVFVGLVEDGLDSCGDIAQEMGFSKGAISKLAKKAERDGFISINGRRYVRKQA